MIHGNAPLFGWIHLCVFLLAILSPLAAQTGIERTWNVTLPLSDGTETHSVTIHNFSVIGNSLDVPSTTALFVGKPQVGNATYTGYSGPESVGVVVYKNDVELFNTYEWTSQAHQVLCVPGDVLIFRFFIPGGPWPIPDSQSITYSVGDGDIATKTQGVAVLMTNNSNKRKRPTVCLVDES